MNTIPRAEAVANAVAVGFLAVAALLLAGVIERWVAAGWMAYKFAGFGTDGYITLSAKTASVLVPVGMLLASSAYGLA